MSIRMEAGLRTLVLALYEEAALTAKAKRLTGATGRLAALRETADLASRGAGRRISEEEVLRVVLSAQRLRRIEAATPILYAPPSSGVLRRAGGKGLRMRRGRLAALAMRSLGRHPSVPLS
ncbi:hypothetical protein [Azospirillum thermophilum]|nr:hypothetical protein [Azospirillum thermophilum]